MKLIIAGTRTFDDYRLMCNSIEDYLGDRWPTYVVCGMQDGADMLGYRWAREALIPVIERPADWRQFGKHAGPMRNTQMAREGDELIAFWDGKSPGTSDMIKKMQQLKKPIHIVRYGVPLWERSRAK